MTTVTAKTTKKNKKKYRRQHLRALAHAPLVVAVAATALCTGTGAGSAATGPAPDEVTASTSTPDTPLESGRPGWDWWSLYNDTGQPIYGTWSEQVGSDVSGLDLVAKWPLPNGGHESRPRNDSNFLPPFGSNSYWIGHLCYNHLWWNLDRMWSLLDHDGAFRLRGEYSGLQVTWNPYYDDVPNEAFLKPNRADGTC